MPVIRKRIHLLLLLCIKSETNHNCLPIWTLTHLKEPVVRRLFWFHWKEMKRWRQGEIDFALWLSCICDTLSAVFHRTGWAVRLIGDQLVRPPAVPYNSVRERGRCCGADVDCERLTDKLLLLTNKYQRPCDTFFIRIKVFLGFIVKQRLETKPAQPHMGQITTADKQNSFNLTPQ